MQSEAPAPELVHETAERIFAAFADYDRQFGAITRRARRRFEEREWKLGVRDAVERIELYDRRVEKCLAGLIGYMGRHIAEPSVWSATRACYAELIDTCPDREFYKTFFNSLTRRIFSTVGVNPEVEFVALELEPVLATDDAPVRSLAVGASLPAACEALLAELPWAPRVADLPGAGRLVANEIARFCAARELGRVSRIETLAPVFYRATRAYLVGRLAGADWHVPLVIALRHADDGIVVDTVMLSDYEVRPLFGFSRSYFHADLPRVGAAVGFLRSMMPGKPTGELFTVLGRAKQGKTERYRTLFHHLQHSSDRFVHAEGERGMVMIVFTLPSLDIVFKVIRDRFAYPKTTSREEVMEKYRFVFRHDRVGRLVDAQEFRRLRFPRSRFSAELRDELLSAASESCRIDGDDLIVEHCYIERRIRPLNLYLHEADEAAARRAAADYGQAIRDLALSNVFPGDLLLKNFGVTRHGRVIFYDYDELCLVTDCRFRDLPAPAAAEDELRAEPWFYVHPSDVFPAQWLNFLGLRGPLREAFLERHAELLEPDYWRDVKRRHASEQHVEVVPYTARPLGVAGGVGVGPS